MTIWRDELKAYNENYEKAFGSEKNRTIIFDFDGEVTSQKVEVVIDGYKDFDTIISGIGNIHFQSCYEEDLNEINS